MKAFTIFFVTALITAILLPTGNTVAGPLETTITVEIVTDEYSQYSAAGTCSLREAITAAVGDAPFGGCAGGVPGESTRIALPTGHYDLSLPGVDDANAVGDLDIFESSSTGELITIDGTIISTTVIDGNGIDRIFDLNAYATVVLQDLTVSNGQSQPTDTHFGYGGGIYNEGQLTLQNVFISSNTAGRDINTAPGGGVFNANLLTVNDSFFMYNETFAGYFSNSAAGGGGLYNNSSMFINRTLFISNYTGDSGGYAPSSASGGDGGGIYNNGSMEMHECKIDGNGTGISSTSLGHGGHGGGIFNAGVADVYASIISHNVTGNGTLYAGGNGGGISNSGTLTMVNTTLTLNITGNGVSGPGGFGGGFYSATGSASIYQSTIAYNTAGTGLPQGNGGGVFITGTIKTLQESIVANNTSSGTSPDCYAFLDDPRYNLIENATNCVFQGSAVGNITGQDPQLLELKLFRQNILVYPLARSSPAVDSGPETCYSAVDQRGSLRPLDGDHNGSTHCDIGSFELGKPFFLPLIIHF
jgi:CSLREA domain-containing protein